MEVRSELILFKDSFVLYLASLNLLEPCVIPRGGVFRFRLLLSHVDVEPHHRDSRPHPCCYRSAHGYPLFFQNPQNHWPSGPSGTRSSAVNPSHFSHRVLAHL